MAKEVSFRKGTTTDHSGFVGAEAEITVDTTKDTAVVHDNVTSGGIPLAREDLSNAPSFTGATSSMGGTAGKVPAPIAGQHEMFLRGDGTWELPSVYNEGILSGSRDPLATDGVDGEYWYNTSTWFFFGPKAAGAWPAGFSIVGPKGDQGDPGPQGIQGEPGIDGTDGVDGANGKTIRNGTVDPTPSDGVTGDFFINTTTWVIFGPKAVGGWPTPGTNLIGEGGSADYPDFVGNSGKYLKVNATEDGVEWGQLSTPVAVSTFAGGNLEASEVIIFHIAVEPTTFPVDMVGSYARSLTAPTADAIFSIEKNGTPLGTLQINAGTTTGTFSMMNQLTLNAGDDLQLIAPSSADASLTGVSITLKGTM